MALHRDCLQSTAASAQKTVSASVAAVVWPSFCSPLLELSVYLSPSIRVLVVCDFLICSSPSRLLVSCLHCQDVVLRNRPHP